MRKSIVLASILALAGCANTTPATNAIATVNADVATATTVAQNAINTYPIVKGIAQVAAVADPSLAGPINAAIAFLDPKVAQASALIAAGSTDVTTLTALATTITQQVQSLTVTAAPAIKVVSSAS